MSKLFVIADTHFGHKLVSGLRGFETIEDHDRELINRWNSVVNKNDTVYLLGDALFSQHALPIIGKLNGSKKLAMGNHDKLPAKRYLEYFSKIGSYFTFQKFLMSHMPVHEYQLGPDKRYLANIHGHMHTHKLSDERYICVSAEQLSLTPILIQDLLNGAGYKT